MLKRTLHISHAAYLTTKYDQLVLRQGKPNPVEKTIPIEDIALVFLDHPQITLSHGLMRKLLALGVALISCDTRHLPAGLLLPLDGHSEMSARWQVQIKASQALKNQLWKQTIEAKICNQRNLLVRFKRPHAAMDVYLERVEPGDLTNLEGQAASFYWQQLFPSFKRDPEGEPPNHYLNFGYAILRSIVARALIRSGLLPALGIFHRNKYNPYCLADDVMEPYRPYVDLRVQRWVESQGLETDLSKAAKAYFLELATDEVIIEGKTSPLSVAATTTTAALYKCLAHEKRTIPYPVL